MNAFECLSLPFRPNKPRDVGLTMVLDKDMGIHALQDLLATAGEYIDLYKFGWGTSRVMPLALLKRKIELLSEHAIKFFPGGTLLEIASAQGRSETFLNECRNLGFNTIEVSDGTVEMERKAKLGLIRKGRALGFTVVSEVGKKFSLEDRRYGIEERTQNALEELDAGAYKVIIESRESGKLGVFDEKGEIIPEYVETLVARVGIQNILFEAPLTHQQEWLILNMGNSVNLGNIAAENCINLETLRCGLRAGTLRDYHLDKVSVFIEHSVSGALHAAAKQDVIVVVDALRASSTIVTALANGMASVIPVTSAEECVGEITAGERGGIKIPALGYDNSPLAFEEGRFEGKELLLTTTNGTECIKASTKYGSPVLVGCLLNASAVGRRALELAHRGSRNITIVMAGRNNQLAPEDLIGASEIVANLKGCSLKGYIKPVFSKDFANDFLATPAGKNLVKQGKRQDVLFCAQKDLYDIVPEYHGGKLRDRRSEEVPRQAPECMVN